MSAHKERGEKNDALVKELNALMCLPGNDVCADCPNKNPDWASVNLGIFICMKCSGIHRMMGTHITKVRAVELDRWNEQQVERIRDIGNTLSNEFWAHSVPVEWQDLATNAKSSVASDKRKEFIFKKYTERAFINVHDDPDL